MQAVPQAASSYAALFDLPVFTSRRARRPKKEFPCGRDSPPMKKLTLSPKHMMLDSAPEKRETISEPVVGALAQPVSLKS